MTNIPEMCYCGVMKHANHAGLSTLLGEREKEKHIARSRGERQRWQGRVGRVVSRQ